MLRKVMVLGPVGAFLSAIAFTTAALTPNRCEAINLEVDYIFYSDCSFNNAIGERDILCYGQKSWGDISGDVLIRNYYTCDGQWLSCQSTCGWDNGYYAGCGIPGTPFAYIPPYGCAAAPSRAPRPAVRHLAAPGR
jgi:hypothetical protein